MNATLYLMRHGQTVPEKPWRFLGQRELPLSDVGRAQAAWWRNELSSVNFAGVWCSDLLRCRETAELLLKDRNVQAVKLQDLREISLGEWDGLSIEEVKHLYPGQYQARGTDLAGFHPPGGESFEDLAERACKALERILASNSDESPVNLLVVAHAGVNRVLLCRMLGMPLDRLFSLAQYPACLNIVSIRDCGPVLSSLNVAPAL
jgi:probable phosphoglycerate mutase